MVRFDAVGTEVRMSRWKCLAETMADRFRGLPDVQMRELADRAFAPGFAHSVGSAQVYLLDISHERITNRFGSDEGA